jgi:hypothetical protein
MRDAAPSGAPGDLVPEWELIAYIATGAFDDAEQLLEHCGHLMMFELSHAQDILRYQRGDVLGVTSHDIDQTKRGSESKAYSLLALGFVDLGLDTLETAVAENSSQGNAHWISFRLPIYSNLFDTEIIEHRRYRRIVEALALDEMSRRKVQKLIADLSSVTGVAPAPLIAI